MRGFMIYETPLWGDEENVVYLQEVNNASYTLKQIDSDITCYLEGIATKEPVTKAECNKDDTYDFEMGALIALMKKCGREKVAKACCEVFPHETSGSIYIGNKQYRERIKELRKENECLEEKVDNLYAYNKSLINDIDKKNHEIISLKALKLTNESLKKDNESFRKSLEKLKEENKSLKKEKEQIIVAKDILYNKLREENEKLKLDCEKLRHGYNTELPLWQKEFLNQLYGIGIYKESKNKTELPITLDINGITIQIKDSGKENKPLTKREQMCEKIFELHKESDIIFEVKREDVNAFLHEIENRFPEITWRSGVKIFETKYAIKDIYFELKTRDRVYFRLSKETKLSYSSDPDIYRYRELKHIEYLPPMRWDLFKKGRIVVGVRKEHYNEFKEEINRQFGIINIHKPYDNFNYSFFIFDKNANFIEAIGRSQFRQIKEMNNHKVYYWEDVK